MTTDKNAIGKRIREARLAKGLTQEQLGKAAGNRSVNQINGYERGRSRPSPPVLKDIAAALGVSPDALAKQNGEQPSAPGAGFVQLFKDQYAAAIGVPASTLKLTIEVSV